MATYYVDPLNGSDSNNGSSIALAFKSTAKSETVVVAGDTVKLLATGNESLVGTNTITLAVSGVPNNQILWQGCDMSGNTLADGSYYTIDGSGMSSGTDVINTAATKNRRIRNVLITNSKRFGISTTSDPAYAIIFESCSIINPATACFGTSTSGIGYGFLVVNGVFTGSGSGGTQRFSYSTPGIANRSEVIPIGCLITGFNTVFSPDVANGQQSLQNCVFANNGSVIPAELYAQNMSISNCLFFNNTLAIGLSDRSLAGGARFSQITSCSFVNNTTAIAGYDTTIGSESMSFNHYYNNTTNFSGAVTSGLHDVVNVNPLFNSPGTFDFRLQSGSPLIGGGPRGTNIAGLSQVGGGGGMPLIGEGMVF